MKEQSHRLVMTTSVMSSAFHLGEENMKIVESQAHNVCIRNRTIV